MKNGAKMEARGSPTGEKNGGISWTFRNPLPGALQGRVWGGFWMDLGRILGGFWRDLGALGGPNGHENQYISKKILALPLGSPKEGFG